MGVLPAWQEKAFKAQISYRLAPATRLRRASPRGFVAIPFLVSKGYTSVGCVNPEGIAGCLNGRRIYER